MQQSYKAPARTATLPKPIDASSPRYLEKLEAKLKANAEFNQNILSDKEMLQHLQLMDNAFLVRCMKHEGEQTSNGLFVERKFRGTETENGRPTTEVDSYDFSKRAVVIKTPELYLQTLKATNDPNSVALAQRIESIKENDIVWLSGAADSPNYAFYSDPRFPVSQWGGYLLIPFGLIQVKESQPFQIAQN